MPFLFRLFATVIALCILWSVLVYSQIGNFTQSSKWVYEAYGLKESYANTIRENKVVIVSGSNALFGFDSAELETFWNMPVVNDAVHGGLGLTYILHKSKKVLGKGDVAILPLEYSLYQEDGRPSEVYSDYILSRDGEYFRGLSLINRVRVISGISFRRLLQGIKLHFNTTLMPTKGVYGIQNINSYGDQINTGAGKMTESQIIELEQILPKIISTSEVSDMFIQTMDEYIDWAKQHDVCLIAAPPSFMLFDVYKENRYTDFLSNIKAYYTSRKLKFIGDPLMYMFDLKYFFNSRYHLNSAGAQKRTNQVINDIGKDIRLHCNGI